MPNFYYTIQNSLINLKSSDGTILRNLDLPASTNHNEIIDDSIVEIKRSDNSIISTINLKVETDNEYIVSDSFINFVDIDDNIIESVSILADSTTDVILDDTYTSTVTIENTNNDILNTTTTLPGETKTLVIDDSEISINNIPYKSLPAENSLNVTVKNTLNNLTGTLIGNEWVVNDELPISGYDINTMTTLLGIGSNSSIPENIYANTIVDIHNGFQYNIYLTPADLITESPPGTPYATGLAFKKLNNRYFISTETAVYTSLDLKTWTLVLNQPYINSLFFNGSEYVFLRTGKTFISNDLISWSENVNNIPSPIGTEYYNNIKYDGTYYYCLRSTNRVYYSTDGINYIFTTLTIPGTYRTIDKINNKYIIIGNSGLILESDDLINWVDRSMIYTTHLSDMTFGNGVYYFSGSNDLYSSTDLINYTIVDTSSTGYNSVIEAIYFNDNKLYMSGGMYVFSTTDLITWNKKIINFSIIDFLNIS